MFSCTIDLNNWLEIQRLYWSNLYFISKWGVRASLYKIKIFPLDALLSDFYCNPSVKLECVCIVTTILMSIDTATYMESNSTLKLTGRWSYFRMKSQFRLNFKACLIGGAWFLIQIPGKRPPQRPEVKDPPSVPWNRVLQLVPSSWRKNASNRSRYVDDIWRPWASGLLSPTVTTSFQLWVTPEIGF